MLPSKSQNHTEAITSAGSQSSKSDWAVGEVVVGTMGKASSGFYESSNITVTEIEMVQGLTLEIFPNPATDQVIISYPDNNETLQGHIFSIDGSENIKFEFATNKTKVDLSGLVGGNYFLILKDKDKQISSYKILKK